MRYQRLTYGYALVVAPAAPVQTAWRPAADVYESATGINVSVEIAGVEPDELNVLCFENAVIVEGRRPLPALEPGGIFHTTEIRRGSFKLEIALPARVSAEPLELEYERGLLTIRLAKAEA
jgi:HSP20 family protein